MATFSCRTQRRTRTGLLALSRERSPHRGVLRSIMPEVACAVALPDFGPPPIHEILSLLLVWDTVEVATPGALWETLTPDHALPLAELAEQGVVRWQPSSPRIWHPETLLGSVRAAGAGRMPEWGDPRWPQAAREWADALVQTYALDVRDAVNDANTRGLACVATSDVATAVASLPALSRQAAESESALIQAAMRSVRVVPGTEIGDILAFRAKNAKLMGRFRGAMIDLAHSLQRDASSSALMAEADAVIKNRVEPVLADLDVTLSRGRVKYAWTMLLGTTTILLGPVTPIATATNGGRVLAQTLAYAFDRSKLVREHPYGLLQAARSELQCEPSSIEPQPVTDPLQEARHMIIRGLEIGADPRYAPLPRSYGGSD